MPIYDYGCTNCGHVLEVIHGVHEPGPTVCPECGGLLRKRISPPTIHFRGTGWAKKDARQATEARAAKAGKADKHGTDKDGAIDRDGAAKPGGGPEPGGYTKTGAGGAGKASGSAASSSSSSARDD